MSRARVVLLTVTLVVAAAVVAGCTGATATRTVPPSSPATTTTRATTTAVTGVAGPATVRPVVATVPSDAERIAVAHWAVTALGRVVPRPGAADDGAAIRSGSATLVGRDGTGWLDATVTSGQWTVRITCTGTGTVTAYAAAPSVLTRLDVGATATPDTRGTARTVVPCGTVVAFDTGRPGGDGLSLRVDSADGSPLTGVAFELARAG